ncbi:MAG TPA: DUF302 domain-containing protein [Blastocatellia bacterium]|nr:DUF302 domain-containing protein [Blastocatellia bacterium]
MSQPVSEKTIGYGFSRKLDLSFAEAIERVKETLKVEGFGVLSEINITEKFKEKLGVEFRNYVILGACNPPIAYQALQEELGLGLLLPCNVIVYEDAGKCVVAAIDAAKMMSVVGNPKLESAATLVNEKLQRAIANL